MSPMGGRFSVARLLTSSLAVVMAVWVIPAGPADAWRLRVSARLQSVYDAPAAARASVPSARFNARGWVQADVHYDCSDEARSVLSTSLSVSSSIRLVSYCVLV